MTPKQEILIRLAREAMEDLRGYRKGIDVALAAIDEALAEPEEKYQYGTPLLDAMTGKTEQPANVAAVNTLSERVDKQAQNVHMQPAQVPVAWIEHGSDEVPSIVVWERGSSGHYTPLYTSSRPSKPWVGLTAQDLIDIYNETERDDRDDVIRLTEAKLKELNT